MKYCNASIETFLGILPNQHFLSFFQQSLRDVTHEARNDKYFNLQRVVL